MGEHLLNYLVGALWLCAITPAALLHRWAGWEWKVGTAADISIGQFTIMVAINCFLLAAIGGIIGLAVAWKRGSRVQQNKNHE